MKTIQEITDRYTVMDSVKERIVSELKKLSDADKVEYAQQEGMHYRYSQMIPSGQMAMDLINHSNI